MENKKTRRRKSDSAKKSEAQKKKVERSKNIFSCNFCAYTTNQKYNLTNHIRVHTQEKPYKCQHPNCTAAFAQNRTLKQHQLVHNKDDESLLKFKCALCPYKTGISSDLNRHLKAHSDVKDFICDLCPYRAKQQQHIISHHIFVHSTEKLFKCPQTDCEASCKTKSQLNCHLKVHSNERPFVCSLANCNFKTKWKSDLTKHEMTHVGEKPFKCSFCTYSCTQKGHLVKHIRVHTGETPYRCQNCEYRAKSSSHLRTHQKLVHQREKKSK